MKVNARLFFGLQDDFFEGKKCAERYTDKNDGVLLKIGMIMHLGIDFLHVSCLYIDNEIN